MDWIYLFQLFVVFSFDCVGVGRGKVTMVVWLPGSLWFQWWWCDDWSSWYCHAMSLPVLLPTSTHTHSQSPTPPPPPPPPPPLPPTVSTTPTAILGHQHQLAKMANIAAQQADFIFYLTLYLLSHSGWSLAERERERERVGDWEGAQCGLGRPNCLHRAERAVLELMFSSESARE